jgi:hypothetical protein
MLMAPRAARILASTDRPRVQDIGHRGPTDYPTVDEIMEPRVSRNRSPTSRWLVESPSGRAGLQDWAAPSYVSSECSEYFRDRSGCCNSGGKKDDSASIDAAGLS